MHPGTKTPGSSLEDLRLEVDAAYAAIPDIKKLELELAAAPDDAAQTNSKGEVIDSIKRQEIADARKAVINAIETMPIPASLSSDDEWTN